MEKNLTVGNPFRIIFKFALPVIGGNLFQLFYTIADTVIVGRSIGSKALAAVGATSIIIYLILCFINGLTGGFGIKLGHMFGAKDRKGMKRSITASAQLSILFTLIITSISTISAKRVLIWMNTPDEIYNMAYDYMFIIFLGTGATVFYNWISNVLRALGDSKTPLYFLVFSSILNVILDIIFILPLNMGVSGAAIATVLSQLTSAVLCTIYAFKKFEVMHVSKEDWIEGRKVMIDILKIAFPMGFQMSVMCIGQLAMQSAVNRLGTDAIAGYTAATKVDQMSVLINNAFGIAIANYVAQNYGAGFIDRIKKGVTSSLIQVEISNLIIGILILILQPVIVPLFVSDPSAEIFMYAKGYLYTIIPFYFFLGVLIIYRTAIQSMGNTWAPFTACIVELILRILSALGLSQIWGYTGICFSSPLAWIGAVSLLVPVYFSMIRYIEKANICGECLNI